MKPIYIFRHIASEGPGYFGDFLDRHQINYHIIRADEGEAIPETLNDCSALVFMGGPMSVNDGLPWIQPELQLIRQAIENGMPVLGHCLGGQLISKALGGTVKPNHVKEYGWFDVQQQENDIARAWLSPLPEHFSAFHWHGETFSIPAGATNIISSEHCAHQGFVIGNTLALQCHVEMTPEMVLQWADEHAQEIAQPTNSIQTLAAMTENLESKIAQLQANADVLYSHWLQHLPRD